ncbi:MAG: TIR domain-containing protein [Candidatus Marithrix sp.]
MNNTQRNKIFLCYEQKHGSEWIDELELNLKYFLKHNGIISDDIIWSDNRIDIGSDWENSILKALDESTIAICFLSNYFFASSFIQKTELPYILKGHEKGLIEIHPIFISFCHEQFKISELNSIQTLNSPEKPLDKENDADKNEKLSKIASKIYSAWVRRTSFNKIIDTISNDNLVPDDLQDKLDTELKNTNTRQKAFEQMSFLKENNLPLLLKISMEACKSTLDNDDYNFIDKKRFCNDIFVFLTVWVIRSLGSKKYISRIIFDSNSTLTTQQWKLYPKPYIETFNFIIEKKLDELPLLTNESKKIVSNCLQSIIDEIL